MLLDTVCSKYGYKGYSYLDWKSIQDGRYIAQKDNVGGYNLYSLDSNEEGIIVTVNSGKVSGLYASEGPQYKVFVCKNCKQAFNDNGISEEFCCSGCEDQYNS